jgi:adenylate cyclase
MRTPFLQTSIALILAAAWGAGLGMGHLNGNIPLVDGVEATLTNLRTVLRGKHEPADAVTIVAIDDETAKLAGAYPLPRATLAKVVAEITKLKPKAIALDILLIDPGPDDGDSALALALKGSNSVIAGAAVFPHSLQRSVAGDDGPLARLPNAQELLLPARRFSDVAASGLVNFQTDESGTPRLAPMLFLSGEHIEPSFPLSVVTAATGTEPSFAPDSVTIGGHEIATDVGHLLPVSFYGPRGTIPTHSATAALNGMLPAAAIEGHIVLVGAAVAGGGDVFPTPFDPVLPGVEVVATAVTHLMTGDSLVRNRSVRQLDVAFAVALPLVLVGLLAWRRSSIGLAAVAAVVVACMGINFIAFINGIWLAAALPIIAAMPPAIIFGGAQILAGRRQAVYFARQSELLQRIQAQGLATFLAHDPKFLEEPVRQDAAVVFIDISGFTGLSETIGPIAVRELLNDFYDLVDDEVAGCGGAIISFMGDGAMILFGLPTPHQEDAVNAARCCLRLTERMNVWLKTLPEANALRIGFKIGAHFGTIVASRLGAGNRQQITATGDTVNVASRLMEVAARHKAAVAVSNALLIAMKTGEEIFKDGTLEGPIETVVRGRSGAVSIWLWRSPFAGTSVSSRHGKP